MTGRPAPTDADEPAEILSGVWELLDELPRAAASARLAATTVEMAAVTAERDALRRELAAVTRREADEWLAALTGRLGVWRSVSGLVTS
jgi:hypothetical protein